MNDSLDELIKIADEILRTKYEAAELAFLAGSIVRGEGTEFSDLDIVVIYKNLPNAFRESFYFKNYPVEVFANTPETLNYYMTEADARRGALVMANMVAEGIEIPAASALSQRLKLLAEKCLATKPPPLAGGRLDRLRYQITNLIDDIRAPRSADEMRATATELYQVLADFYLRAGGFWSARNKSIPRVLQKVNAELRHEFLTAFTEFFAAGEAAKVIELTEKILAPHGGFLFDGFRLDSSPDCRKPLE